MTEKILKPDAPITQEQLLKAIEELLKQQELEREGLKKDREQKRRGGSVGSLIDVPLYREEKPSLVSLINKFRGRLNYADGGSVSEKDIGQVKYLIQILENAPYLSAQEAQILEDLYSDLKKMGVRANEDIKQ
jgi:hypothetical protein